MKKTNLMLAIFSLVLMGFSSKQLIADEPPIPLNSNGNYSITLLEQLDYLARYVNNVDNCASNGKPWTSAGKGFDLEVDLGDANK